MRKSRSQTCSRSYRIPPPSPNATFFLCLEGGADHAETAGSGLSLQAHTHCGTSRKRPFICEPGSTLLPPRGGSQTFKEAVICCCGHPSSALREDLDRYARSTGLGNRRATDYQSIMSQFTPNMTKAANRNWDAAERLRKAAAPDRTTVGYLYGIAAECAIKALFREISWTTDSRDGPVYAHFPSLKTKLRDAISGRGAAPLARFTDQGYMEGWAIDIRYSDGTRPDDATLDRWRQQADEARAALT